MTKTTFTVKRDTLEVVIERVFDVSRKVLWKALANPKLIPEWWGPAKYKTVVDKMNFKVGGEWRFVQSDSEGHEFAFHGVYKEIKPMERISDTFNFEGLAALGILGDHELIETATLEELGKDKTRITSVAKYKTIEDLDGMVNSGMEGGAVESWERLAHFVSDLTKQP